MPQDCPPAPTAPGAAPIAEETARLSMALRRELAVITASQGVRDDTVKLKLIEADGSARISFVLQTETPVDPSLATGILPEEPIAFVYDNATTVGSVAPALVLSGREDFPRNLSHLNPVQPGSPVCLCLARAGLQPVYERYGVEGVMARLRAWMRDALTGGLTADGWDPVPFAMKMPMRGGLLDAAVMQEIAASRRAETGWTSGVARITALDEGDHVIIYPQEISAQQPAHNSALSKAVKAMVDGKSLVGVPWVFVWPADERPIAAPVFGLWRTFGEMLEALSTVGLADPLNGAIGHVLANGCDCKHAPGRQTLVVLVGLWRPVPISQNIFGLSSDPNARRLEIKVYTLETTARGNVIGDDTPVRAVVADPLPSPALYRWTTGTPPLGGAALLGYGALGSAMASHLLRSGAEEITGIDADKMMPHNLARHEAEMEDVYKPKVEHLEKAAANLAMQILKPRVRIFKEDIAKLTDEQLTEHLGGSRLIIDATANERVRGRLTEFNARDRRQIIRTEIYYRGRLGIQFVTGASGNPSLLDLYYILCREALIDDGVMEWLLDEDFGSANAEELIFGFGCASLTTRLPNFVVAQHAAAFMPTVIRGLHDDIPSGIGINGLDTDFRPAGWRWSHVAEFRHFEPAGAPGWSVRIQPDVLVFMAAQRESALPIETGGYLYGGWDPALRRIVIVEASPVPPDSLATDNALKLGPAGRTPVERRLSRRTRGRVGLCGTWHSHPDDSAAMSPRDAATMESFVAVDQERGVPTLLVIVAANGEVEVNLSV